MRCYNSQNGRWVNRDPIWFPANHSLPVFNVSFYPKNEGGFAELFSETVSLVCFVSNNPLNVHDFLGLASDAHEPGGPWHPPVGVSTKCTQSDSCQSIFRKMSLLSEMIVSHQGWICQAPPFKQTPGHQEELDNYWRAYANCGSLWYLKQCPGTPPLLDGSPHRNSCKTTSICEDGRCKQVVVVAGKTAATCVGAYVLYKIAIGCAGYFSGGPIGACIALGY